MRAFFRSYNPDAPCGEVDEVVGIVSKVGSRWHELESDGRQFETYEILEDEPIKKGSKEDQLWERAYNTGFAEGRMAENRKIRKCLGKAMKKMPFDKQRTYGVRIA